MMQERPQDILQSDHDKRRFLFHYTAQYAHYSMKSKLCIYSGRTTFGPISPMRGEATQYMSAILVELGNSASRGGEDGGVGSCARFRDITSVFSNKASERVAVDRFTTELYRERRLLGGSG